MRDYLDTTGRPESPVGRSAAGAGLDAGGGVPRLDHRVGDNPDPAEQLPRGRYHHSPPGSHLAIVDDQEAWSEGPIGFLKSL